MISRNFELWRGFAGDLYWYGRCFFLWIYHWSFVCSFYTILLSIIIIIIIIIIISIIIIIIIIIIITPFSWLEFSATSTLCATQ